MKVSKKETKKTAIQLLKYGVIGASNTLITLVAFYVFNTLLKVPYTPSNVIGYILGVINSFVWNRNWVFKTKQNVKREALLFVVGFLICWVLQMGVSVIMLEAFNIKNFTIEGIPNAGQDIVMIVSMVFYTLANYLYNRFVTFKVKGESTEK